MNLDSTIFTCDDPAVIEGYLAHAHLERDLLNLAVDEAKERWQRLPMIVRGRARNEVLGLSVRPYDWSWEEARDRWVAADPENKRWWWNADRHDPVVIPEGWRKRVKDDYISPPLKGSSPAIKAAQDYCRRWSKVETLRGYLERVHGAPVHHFSGLRFLTTGADVQEDKLWIISGPGYEVADERFKPTPLSEYVAMKERNPEPKTDEEGDD